MIGETFRNGIERHDGAPEMLGNKRLSQREPWKCSPSRCQGLTQILEDQSREVIKPPLLWV